MLKRTAVIQSQEHFEIRIFHFCHPFAGIKGEKFSVLLRKGALTPAVTIILFLREFIPKTFSVDQSLNLLV